MTRSLLASVIDVQRWLEQDRATPLRERVHRDRAIGRTLAQRTNVDRVIGWWSCVEPAHTESRGARVVALRRLCIGLLVVGGLLVGVGIGTVAFSYRGPYPVNVFGLLGVLVGLPFLLLVLSLLLLPGRVPGSGMLSGALAGVHPGRWAGAWLDRLAELDLFSGLSDRRRPSPFARWQLLVFAQWFAVGYFVGVLVVAWLLVAVTDLAFGWSTTLEVDPARVHGWLAALAWPWSGWLPEAVPDRALVDASRIFRLETGGMPQSRAVELGRWWPFVLMVILVYGLVPRVLVLALGAWRLDRATRSLLTDHPDVTALLDRLSEPSVTFARDSGDVPVDLAEPLGGPVAVVADATTRVVLWNAALDVRRLPAWVGGAPASVLELAVWQDPADIRARLARGADGVQRLLVFTKGWEPPLLEFFDFLDLLRDLHGAAASITVLPVNVPGDGIEANDREVWARALARRVDPKLYVMQPTTAREPRS